jgi:hypothetical protein
MLTSILVPVVHGADSASGRPSASRRSWLGLAALHSLGNVVAATATGSVLVAAAALGSPWLGAQTTPWALRAVALLALLYLPREMGVTRMPPLLESTRQVPRRWAFDYPRWVGSLLFGLGLGSGLYTRVVSPAFYLLLLWPFVLPSVGWTLGAWFTYGLVRSANVWWLGLGAPLANPFPYASRITSLLLGRAQLMHRANAVLLVVVAAWSAP